MQIYTFRDEYHQQDDTFRGINRKFLRKTFKFVKKTESYGSPFENSTIVIFFLSSAENAKAFSQEFTFLLLLNKYIGKFVFLCPLEVSFI